MQQMCEREEALREERATKITGCAAVAIEHGALIDSRWHAPYNAREELRLPAGERGRAMMRGKGIYTTMGKRATER